MAADFMKGRVTSNGISDDMYGNAVRAHMKQNWMINPTFENSPPLPNGIGGGDNQSYRVMPGRKSGSVYSGDGSGK